MIESNGKRIKKEKPLIPNLVFIYTDYQTALSLPNNFGIEITYIRNIETKKLLSIPEKQMNDFMFLVDFSEEAIKVDNTNLKRGQRVRLDVAMWKS